VQYVLVLFASIRLASITAFAQTGPDFFEAKIRPVLAKNCYACHSAQVKQALGGIRLDSRESFLAANVVVPGKHSESRLYRSLSYAHSIKMPPSGKLDEASLADFRQWIDSGAEFPAAVNVAKPQAFWAFQALPKAPVELQIPHSSKAPRLDKAALLRRVTFDLTGLPPSLGELDAFLSDQSPNAYSKVVDRLLASPHYGERWARHWLDLVRYAETNGHEFDNDKLAPWRYRDYVIRAFNEDLPYNQFIREHIAGDLLPAPRLSHDGASVESPLATAFYFFGEVLNSSTDPVKTRADVIDNQIDVIGKAFTGLTIACARCHDHKFDPIPTAEYYGIAGILQSTDYREIILDSPARARKIAQAVQPAGALVPTPSSIEARPGDQLVSDFNGKHFNAEDFSGWRVEGVAFGKQPLDGSASSLAAGAPEFVGTLTSPMIQMSDLKYLHVRLGGSKVEARANENAPLRLSVVCAGHKGRHIVPEAAAPKWFSLPLILERNRQCYIEIIDHSRSGYITVDHIVFSDLAAPPATSGGLARQGPLLSIDVPPSSFGVSAADGIAGDIQVHVRGDHKQLGDPAPRRFLSILAGPDQAPITQGSGRMELADRIASPNNPLTARVLVNRLWKHHFGEGLVKSTDNFGIMGERPQNQQLLDSLAASFIASGWRIKPLQRMLVLSDWYQSTALKPRRLEAEALRDNILAVSGRLDPTLFGPSITPHIGVHQNGRGRPSSGPLDGKGRRSIYVQIRRNFIPPLFTAFDFPSPASTIGVRGSSAVPSQALILLNNEFVHQQAALFAASVLKESSSPTTRVDSMYRRAFARAPLAEERQRIEQFLAAQSERTELEAYSDLAHVLFNSPEFVYVP
jgi:hypothetical protein